METEWQVITYPDKRLRQVAAPVVEITDEMRKMAIAMMDIMHDVKGIGMAAPQVGWSVRILGINLSGARSDGLVFVNPKIVTRSVEECEAYEACLSVPGISGKVKRPKAVSLTAMNLDGEEREFALDGLLARCFLHEFDHIDGVLYIDRLSPAKKISIRGKLRRLGGPEE
jgi:peptide deformylase